MTRNSIFLGQNILETKQQSILKLLDMPTPNNSKGQSFQLDIHYGLSSNVLAIQQQTVLYLALEDWQKDQLQLADVQRHAEQLRSLAQ